MGGADEPARLRALRCGGRRLGHEHQRERWPARPRSCRGHPPDPAARAPDPETFGDLTERERAALASLEHSAEWDSGYSQEHATRPQTIGYALVDSPAALCAWIIEKFWAWTDCHGHPENLLSGDELLHNLMFYWLPRAGASSARLYWESIRQINEWISGSTIDTVAVPTGCSVFPKELQRPSRRWAEKRFVDIRYWNEPERGGHFAAFEQPELFVEDVRSFFRLVRCGPARNSCSKWVGRSDIRLPVLMQPIASCRRGVGTYRWTRQPLSGCM